MVTRRFPPLPTVRDILKMYQITAKKNLSQNFILDPSVLRRFVKAAGNLNDKYVIEVGPGPGGITRTLLEKNPKQVLVIEKDPRFVPSLKLLQESAGGPEKLSIHIGDCIHYNVEKLIPETAKKPWDGPDEADVVLVGNLPFNVATPFLIKLMSTMDSKSNLFSFGRASAILTFQHEVAHRMNAEAHDPERCRLSVMCQNYAIVDYLYTIPGGAFVPPPEVDVGVVRLTPLRQPYIRDRAGVPLPFGFVNKVVSTLFRNKQKFIRNSLIHLFPSVSSFKLCHGLLDLAGLNYERTAISLSMDEIEKICIAYGELCEELKINPDFVPSYCKDEISLTEKFLRDEDLVTEKNENTKPTFPKFNIQF